MKTSPRVVLETRRLVLREMSLADLDFVTELRAHPEVMRFYPKCYSREESAEWIERHVRRYAEDGHALWLAQEHESGEPVGTIGLTYQLVDDVPTPEIGYLVHRPYWRRGLASEAAAATRDWAFGELGLPRVISLVRPVNLPSQGVARRIGMRPERNTWYSGYDHIVFALERESG